MQVDRLCGDVIVMCVGRDRWCAYNIRARTAVGVSSEHLPLLDASSDVDGEEVEWWVPVEFGNEGGLLADPTRIRRPAEAWGPPEVGSREQFSQVLRDNLIWIGSEEEYLSHEAPKSSILDPGHFGNFHQQLGERLVRNLRVDRDEWWLAQKFDGDRRELGPNAYRAIQEPLVDAWIAERMPADARALDLGCGPGYFTRKLAQSASEVIGVDPNPLFLDIARRFASANQSYVEAAIGTPGALEGIDGEFDVIFMSDALLFYFVTGVPGEAPDLGELLRAVKRLLRRGGVFVDVEPNYQFWLAPWLGIPERPFTVLAEHRRRMFQVTPTPVEYLKCILESGFVLKWASEAEPLEWFGQCDQRAFGFAREFPLWQLYEFAPESM